MSRSVCVIGAGKLGLPMAVQAATRGHNVIAADISAPTVEAINAGVVPFEGEPGLQEKLEASVCAGVLSATSDVTDAVSQSEVVIVLVPLVVDATKTPDFTAVDSATVALAKGLKKGALVSYETTLPVGTTRNRFGSSIHELAGYEPGVHYSLVHSPERVLTGRIFQDLARYPKLVGGVTDSCTEEGARFYESILTFDIRPDLPMPNGVWSMANAETAELTKLAETTYRNINIAFANELAIFAQTREIDVYDVIRAANSQPYSHIHNPGISVGGHCIPVYPHLYTFGDPEAVLAPTAAALNDSMPGRTVALLKSLAGSLEGEVVVVLGLAYRDGVKEHAFSGTFALCDALAAEGAVAQVIDPLYTDDEIRQLGFEPYGGEGAFAAILHTAHPEFRAFGHGRFPGVKYVVDGRNFLEAENWEPATYVSIGR